MAIVQKIKSNQTLVIILSIVILAVIIYAIYKLIKTYNKEYSNIIDDVHKATNKAAQLFKNECSNNNSSGSDSTAYKVYSSDKLSDGDSYTYSFWIKINDMNFKYGQPKHVFHRGDKDAKSVNPGVWIYPNTNNLMIRIDTYGKQNNTNVTKSGKQCQYWSSQFPHTHNYTDTNYPTKDLGYHNNCRNPTDDKKGDWCLTTDPDVKKEYCSIKNYTEPVDMNPTKMKESEFDPDDQCDLINIPVQTWVHIGIVLYERTLDVYLNGELARSCKYANPPRINSEDIHLFDNDGFDGDISDFRYYNKPLSADKIKSIFSKGYEK